MTVKEFAESRGVEPGTVYVYLSRHPEIRREHTTGKGKSMELDDEAVQRLSKQYPDPPPTIIDGVPREEYQELMAKYAAAQEQIARIQTERLEERQRLIEAETRLQLLEDKNREEAEERERTVQELKDQKAQETKNLTEQLETEKRAREEVEEELKRLRARGLWARIRNV